MSPPILATKLYIPPPRPKVVPRPHLIERLNEGLYRTPSVALISASAGFGKTTLLSSWIYDLRLTIDDLQEEAASQEKIVNPKSKIVNPQVAWLSLDEGDNDPSRFLTYLVAAVQTITPKIGVGVLAMLHSPQPLPSEAMLTILLNDLTTLPNHFTLILDDYHVIEAKAVDKTLTFLLEHLPPQMHLVIATREDPPLPLARLRARGQLTELRAADLRFTPGEVATFLNEVMDLSLSAEEVTSLESRTEGWIAGLQLAALSMRGRDASHVTGFIKAFAGDNRYIVDYLVEEVLQRQPEPLRRFLLQTSILDRLNGPLCNAVTGQGESNPLLQTLERVNLFVVPLDDKRHWYRYHHLFADVLRAHLKEEQPEQVSVLHRRASAWYEQNDWPAEAIRHALAAKDFERAAALIELAWPAMDGRFQSATWLGWVKALPDELVRARPVLSVSYAWAFLSGGQLEAGEARLQDAERWLDSTANRREQPEAPMAGMVVVDEEQFRFLPASIATARAYQAQARGDVSGSVTYAQRALDLLPEEDHLRRGPAAALLGLAQWASGDLEAAHQSIAEAMANFQRAGNLHFALSGTYGLANIRLTQGRLREAVRTYEQSLQLVVKHGEPAPTVRGTADLYLGLAELHCEQGHWEIAAQYLLRSEELGEQLALPDWPHRLRVAQAGLKEAQSDLTGALSLLDEAERLYYRTPVPDVRPIAALKARVWVRQGRLAEALGWARERNLSADDDLSYLREFEYITLAKLLIARYNRDQIEHSLHEAMDLLERLLKAAEAGGRMGSVIEILVLQALAHQEQADIPRALVSLERALTLAEPEGYVRIFVGEGLPVATLLREMTPSQGAGAEDGTRSVRNYIDRLLTSFLTPALRPDTGDLHLLVEPLSQRELEVLQLIAQGRSNREISERLFIALSTVKGHNQIIFDKLQVQNRTGAVARARELGLL